MLPSNAARWRSPSWWTPSPYGGTVVRPGAEVAATWENYRGVVVEYLVGERRPNAMVFGVAVVAYLVALVDSADSAWL